MNQPSRAPGGGSGGTQTGKAVLVIAVVVVVGWLVLRHGSSSTTAATTPTTHAAQRPPRSSRRPARPRPWRWSPPPSIKLQVLNGVLTRQSGERVEQQAKGQPRLQHPAPRQRHRQGDRIGDLRGHRRLPAAKPTLWPWPSDCRQRAVNPTIPLPATAPIPADDRTAANLVLVIGPDLAGSA